MTLENPELHFVQAVAALVRPAALIDLTDFSCVCSDTKRMEELFSRNQQMKEQQRILTDNIKTLENRWAFPPLVRTLPLPLCHVMDHALAPTGQVTHQNMR